MYYFCSENIKYKYIMAIKKKGNVDFLKDVTTAELSSKEENPAHESQTPDSVQNTVSINKKTTKKKSLDNWGRPRKLLIDGVKETSITVQLPDTLIKVLRKEAKKQGKSMKELIGTPLLSAYADLLK